jgi:hypothetical protein
MLPGTLLLSARHRAGLSQRALAARARTAQSAVARIELGATSPTWDTLTRLLEAAGFALDTALTPVLAGMSHMLDDVPRILALSPDDRLNELASMSRLLSSARRG